MFLVASIFIFILDVGTGAPIAIKTKSLNSIYLKKPSILIGDFMIIPLTGGLIINHFYTSGQTLTDLFSPIFLIIIGVVAITLAVFSALRFRTLSPWYIPHGLFYVFMAFIILLFLIGNLDLKSSTWWLVLIGICTHLLLGHFFPKKFPKIK